MSKDRLEIAVRRIRPDEEEPDRLPLRWSTVARLLAFTGPHRGMRNTLLGLCVFRAMALPGLAWLVGHIIKGPVAAGDGVATFQALALFTVFFVVADVALYWRIRLAHQIGENVLRDLRDKLMAHLLTQPLSFFHARRHGSLISRMISDIEAMRNGIQNNFFISFVSFGQMSCAAALMLLANPQLFLVLLAIVPCLLLVHGFFRGKILHASRVQQETFSRVTSALAETVQGIRVTQGFAREDTNAGIFTRLVRSLAGNVVKTASLTSLYLPLLELNAQGFMAALIGVGGWAALSGTGTGLGDLVTFFFLADLFFSPITIIGTQLSEATLAMAGAERYFRLLDTPPAWTDKPTAAACPPLRGHVEFRDTHFAYVQDRPVLHGISFVAQPGQVIALVGHTGSGKSTIIGLLAKFQLPLSGQVLIDGHDLADLKQETLRRQMGFVFQQNFLFAGTIAENVKAARPEATDEEIRQAFRDLDCLDLIEDLPAGIHTPCSEKGRGLSMGQQQLVAFARALMADPRILVLDEATSAVDTLTEARLQVALARLMKGRTCFVVAHRLSTIRRADCVLVLDQGRIVERGSHDELLTLQGTYAGLHRDFLSSTT
jgi:ATP-binding cassette subfamily B protein